MRTPEWATYGSEGREKRNLSSIYLDPPQQEEINFRLERRWQEIKANEVQYKEYYLDDAEFAVVGFGTSGRIALSAVRAARARGIKVGLFRPVSLAPFPEKELYELSKRLKGLLVIEMNAGQMLDDVLNITRNQIPVEFYGRMGGILPMPEEIEAEIERMVTEPIPTEGHPRDRWLARFGKLN